MAGKCGNHYIHYDEETITPVALNEIADLTEQIDPAGLQRPYFWNYETARSVLYVPGLGNKGGKQRMYKKLASQLEAGVSRMV